MRLLMTTAILLMSTTTAASSKFEVIGFDLDCNLVVSGRGATTEIRITDGRRNIRGAGCEATIEIKSFNRHFEHCAISGLFHGTSGKLQSCGFNYYDTAKTKVYFSSYPENTGCEFICNTR